MIERQFVSQKIREFNVNEHIQKTFGKVGHSHTKIQRTPLGDKIVIYAARPGLIIGRQGENIKTLTKTLKNKFGLENPQVEIVEVENVNLDAQIVAETIAGALERFGADRFKGIAHKAITDCLKSGALGIEILLSGKVPSARAKTWRFYSGYIKKCGDVAQNGMRMAVAEAALKSGIVGIQVKLMPPDIRLPDKIIEKVQEVKVAEEKKETTEATMPEIKVEEKTKKPKKNTNPRKPKSKKTEEGEIKE